MLAVPTGGHPPHKDHGVGGGDDDLDDKGTPDPVLSPAEIAAFASLDENGYVRCTYGKYASCGIKDIGRITTWPENKMYEQRSISCSCFLHRACKTPAAKTAAVDERQLLIWLFSAVEDHEDKSKERLTELRAAHSDEFRRMFHP